MSDQATLAIPIAIVSQPEYTAEQILEQLVSQNRVHAIGINLINLATVGGVPELTDKVVNVSTNTLNVLKQLYQVRAVAAARGYTEILEVLNQKLPYER